MCEMVKRNNGGRLGGRLFGVDDNLIEAMRQLAPNNWENKTQRKIAKIIINGIPLYELGLIQDGRRATAKTTFTLPGEQRVTIPLVIESEAGKPKLFLDTTAKIKLAYPHAPPKPDSQEPGLFLLI